MRQWAVETNSPAETRELGFLLGRILPAPAVLLLTGELGAGKTCLVQGLARGLGVSEEEPVTSPSYTLLNVYYGRCPLYHFDLYRLSGADDLLDLGFDEYLDSDGVTVIEWADRMPGLADGNIRLHLSRSGEDRRRVEIEARRESDSLLLGTLALNWLKKGREQ